MLKVYVKKARGLKWVVCGAELGTLDERLKLNSRHKLMSILALIALI
jgi:hypothetical protein